MRAFIQYRGDLPVNTEAYQAANGFWKLGVETVPFRTVEDLPADMERGDVLVGGIEQVRGRLAQLGVTPPDLNYPEELRSYLGRPVWKSSLDKELWDDEDTYPKFIKPVREKRFTGTVLDHPGYPIRRHAHCLESEPVWVSPVVEFYTEWRVFVNHGEVVDARPYHGYWRGSMDTARVIDMILHYSTAPMAYGLDVGLTVTGETILVEVNDGYSLGSYGLEDVAYARLLTARWCELVGVADPLAIY